MTVPDPWFEYTWPRWERIKAVIRGWIFLVVFPWMAGLFVCGWLLPDWTQPQRSQLTTALFVPVALGVAWWNYGRRYHTIAVYDDRVEFRWVGGAEGVLRADVLGLLGESGLNLDGGELVALSAVRIVTEDRDYSVSFGHLDNEELYPILRGYCPHAWGLPFPGDLEPPGAHAAAARGPLAEIALGRFARLYRRQWLRSLALSLALAVGGAGALVAIALFVKVNGEMSQGLLWLLVLTVAGFFLLGHSVRDFRMLARIERARRAAQGFD